MLTNIQLIWYTKKSKIHENALFLNYEIIHIIREILIVQD